MVERFIGAVTRIIRSTPMSDAEQTGFPTHGNVLPPQEETEGVSLVKVPTCLPSERPCSVIEHLVEPQPTPDTSAQRPENPEDGEKPRYHLRSQKLREKLDDYSFNSETGGKTIPQNNPTTLTTGEQVEARGRDQAGSPSQMRERDGRIGDRGRDRFASTACPWARARPSSRYQW